MKRCGKWMIPVLMVLSLGLLAGSDSECEIEDIYIGGDPYDDYYYGDYCCYDWYYYPW